jgi:hypothetical protein
VCVCVCVCVCFFSGCVGVGLGRLVFVCVCMRVCGGGESGWGCPEAITLASVHLQVSVAGWVRARVCVCE